MALQKKTFVILIFLLFIGICLSRVSNKKDKKIKKDEENKTDKKNKKKETLKDGKMSKKEKTNINEETEKKTYKRKKKNKIRKLSKKEKSFIENNSKSFKKEHFLNERKCYGALETPLISVIINLNKKSYPLDILMSTFQSQVVNNFEIIFICKKTLKENINLIKFYRKTDRRFSIFYPSKKNSEPNIKGKLILNLSPLDMLVNKNTFKGIKDAADQKVFLNFEEIKTKLYNNIYLERNIAFSVCDRIYASFWKKKKINSLLNNDKNLKIFDLYKDANLCLRKLTPPKYLIPLYNNKLNKKGQPKTVLFFSRNRKYSKKFLEQIDELIIGRENNILTYYGTKSKVKKEIMETSGFKPMERNSSYFGNIGPKFKNQTYLEEKYPRKKELITKYHKFDYYFNFIPFQGKYFFLENYRKMKKLFPKDYNYFHETFFYKTDKERVKKKLLNYTFDINNLWIIKPTTNYGGHGIEFIKKYSDILDYENRIKNEKRKGLFTVEKYISNPFLVDKRKTSFRIYVLITGINPIRIYSHQYSFLGMGLMDYELSESSFGDSLVHIVNRGVLDDKKNLKRYEDSKKNTDKVIISIDYFKKKIEEKGGNYTLVRKKIDDIVVKVILSIQDVLKKSIKDNKAEDRNYFHFLGCDFLVDDNFIPHYLETNSRPAFLNYEEIERKFRDTIWSDTLNLVGVVPIDHNDGIPIENTKMKFKKKEEEDLDEAICELGRPRGKYNLLFPAKETLDYYSKFVLNKTNLDKKLWDYVRKKK